MSALPNIVAKSGHPYAIFAQKELDDTLLNIPEHMRDVVKQYLLYGLPPGPFAQSVLANDFATAIYRADHLNRDRLSDYAALLHGLPQDAWGSYDRVREWSYAGGLVGYITDLERAKP